MAIKKFRFTIEIEVEETATDYVEQSIVDGMEFNDGEGIISCVVEPLDEE